MWIVFILLPVSGCKTKCFKTFHRIAKKGRMYTTKLPPYASTDCLHWFRSDVVRLHINLFVIICQVCFCHNNFPLSGQTSTHTTRGNKDTAKRKLLPVCGCVSSFLGRKCLFPSEDIKLIFQHFVRPDADRCPSEMVDLLLLSSLTHPPEELRCLQMYFRTLMGVFLM